MRGQLTLHGVHDGPDEPGYISEMAAELLRFGQGFEGPGWSPQITELHWASLAQELAGASGELLGALSDYAADVAVYAMAGPRAQILRHVEAQILSAGPGCVLFAHSLGSVIAIDLVIQWLSEGKISDGVPRDQWPISSLMTIGSPLACAVPTDRLRAALHRDWAAPSVPEAPAHWVWINAADPHDIVVTGANFGWVPRLDEFEGYRHLGVTQLPDLDTGGFFDSHTGYWIDPVVIAQLFSLMGS